MSDIQPGDVVVCVDVRTGFGTQIRLTLRKGSHYRVSAVEWSLKPHSVFGTSRGGVYLEGESSGDGRPFSVERFRKIRPAEDEFTKLIRKMKPVKERTDA